MALSWHKLEKTLVYFRVYVLGLIFQFGYNIFSAILRAVGDSAATLYFLLISSVINIGLALLIILLPVFTGVSWGLRLPHMPDRISAPENWIVSGWESGRQC